MYLINMLTLRQSIPYKWHQMINDKSNLIKITDTHPNIKLSTTEMYLPLTKMKCKDLYWHMIQQHTHKPSAMEQWYKSNPLLKEANSEAWIRIFKMPFKIIRETKLQSFQYKIVHRTIACNKWLANIKIRTDSICNFCKKEDTLEHFFLHCQNVELFWKHWHTWWNFCTEFVVSCSDVISECILLGFPGEDNIISVLNYCVLIAKHYIYSKKIKHDNNLDLYQYLVYLKQKLKFEKQVCEHNSSVSFDKYEIIYNMI